MQVQHIRRNSVADSSELLRSEPCIIHAMCCGGWTNVLMVRICSWLWRRVKYQLASNKTKQTCSKEICLWHVQLPCIHDGPCVVYVCRYLLFVLAYVLAMSHYTEEHIPLWPHTSACIYTHVHKCLLHTQPISMHMDCHTYLHSSCWILCQHYGGRHRGLHPPPLAVSVPTLWNVSRHIVDIVA